MTLANLSPGYAGLVVYLGVVSGETTTYTAPCAFSEQSLEIEKEIERTMVPDCDDPSKPAVIELDVEASGIRVSGQGLMASQSVDLWDDAASSAAPIPIRVDVIKSDGAIIRRQCQAQVTMSYRRPSDKGRVTIEAQIQSHGVVAREKLAAPT